MGFAKITTIKVMKEIFFKLKKILTFSRKGIKKKDNPHHSFYETPGTVFTTLNFLLNLGPISQCYITLG